MTHRKKLLLTLTLVTVLTGCSTNDTPVQTPPEAPPPSATTSSEYTPASADGPARNVPKPTKPPLADEESREGAQAFLDYLAETRAYAWQTGDTSLVREITAPACNFCLEEYDSIDSHYRDGGWATAGREDLTILDEDLPVDEYGFYAPKTHVTLPEIKVWDQGGQLTQEEQEVDDPQNETILHLNHMDGKWEYVQATPVNAG